MSKKTSKEPEIGSSVDFRNEVQNHRLAALKERGYFGIIAGATGVMSALGVEALLLEGGATKLIGLTALGGAAITASAAKASFKDVGTNQDYALLYTQYADAEDIKEQGTIEIVDYTQTD